MPFLSQTSIINYFLLKILLMPWNSVLLTLYKYYLRTIESFYIKKFDK